MPCRSKAAVARFTLCFPRSAGAMHGDDGDLRQIVLDSFRAHGKQMTDTATAKADNTESYLRYLVRARELL